MEVIEAPTLIEIDSSRFQVSVFPFHVWTRAIVSKAGTTSSGYGFDRSKRISRAKAHSEAIERWIFYRWEETGISPFSGKHEPCPTSTTGFAAGPSEEFAKLGAFHEFCERAILQKISDGEVGLVEISPPSMGLLLNLLLSGYNLTLRSFRAKSKPHFSISVIELSDGILFGSSCDNDAILADETSVLEAVRKLSRIDFWRSKAAEITEPGSFLRTARYWLSENGKVGMNDFLNRAMKCMSSEVVYTPKDQGFETLQIGSRFVAYYKDGQVKIPTLGDLAVPLL